MAQPDLLWHMEHAAYANMYKVYYAWVLTYRKGVAIICMSACSINHDFLYVENNKPAAHSWWHKKLASSISYLISDSNNKQGATHSANKAQAASAATKHCQNTRKFVFSISWTCLPCHNVSWCMCLQMLPQAESEAVWPLVAGVICQAVYLASRHMTYNMNECPLAEARSKSHIVLKP